MGADPLTIEGSRPTRAVLLAGTHDTERSELADSEMLRELARIAGVLDGAGIGELNRAGGTPIPFDRTGSPTIGTLILERRTERGERRLVRIDEARVGIVDPEDPDRALPIGIGTLESVGVNTPMLLGEPRHFAHDGPWTGRVVRGSSPARSIFISGRARDRSDVPRIRVRTPATLRDHAPSGVLVWVSSTRSGVVPESIARVCDIHDLIAVSVDGLGDNTDLAQTVLQHLDALETVRAHFMVDPGRVYAAGFSDGARAASVMTLALPDLFSGALCMGGLGSYHDVPTGESGLVWDADTQRPAKRALDRIEHNRISVLVGSFDFATPEVERRAARLKRDGVPVRLGLLDGISHAMPHAARIETEMRWIINNAQQRLKQDAREAARILPSTPKNPERDLRLRKRLIEVTERAPWSEPAFEAAERLGLSID